MMSWLTFYSLDNQVVPDFRLYNLAVAARKDRLLIKITNLEASNVRAADDCGTSDPYVTILCGSEVLKTPGNHIPCSAIA